MPSSTINLSFDRFGPPGTAGALVILEEHAGETQDVERARLHDSQARDFQVAAILQKSALHDFDINLSVDHELGGSYLVAPKDAVVIHIDTPDGKLIVRPNSKQEFAKIEFTCTANSGDAALARFQAIVAPVLDHLSYIAKVPVHLARSEWIDLKNGVRGYNHTNPYVPMIPAGNNLMQIRVQPLYALYREAKNAASPFYRFLCFYKILEGTSKNVRPKFFQRAKARGVKPVTIKEVVPDDPKLRDTHPQLIGRPILEVANGLLQDMRQEVAHYLLDSGEVMLVSEHDTITRFEEVLWLIELCARVMIDTQERYEQQLV